jgi:hypothetical protein
MKAKEIHRCAYCGKKCKTVDPDRFDGLCAYCTTKALYDESVVETAKLNARSNYNPIPIGK